ncbi:MAG: amine oxidase [Saprospiraceae bacterium]|nr:amine oxidase [Saprospiraceae bacterium]
MNSDNPFHSFWMAGYECADHLNAFGVRVDLINTTGHLPLIDTDYKNLAPFKMSTVREGIRWSQVEKTPYQYDWSEVGAMIQAGKANNIQQIWDLCHFGYPDGLTPLDHEFTDRFVALCTAFIHFYRSIDATSTLIVTPINEVSFISWLGGDAKCTAPYRHNQGWEVKYNLMKAYIKGIDALRAADPSVRILTTEPLINIVPCQDATPEAIKHAAAMHEAQFQVTEMLCGRLCPELGGDETYLDMLGYNFYYNNQWTAEPHEFLDWKIGEANPKFMPLHKLLIAAYQKYNRPFVLTETSHPKEDRPLWIKMIEIESQKLFQAELPFWGICWYPMVNRPDWDYLHDWHYAGIWDDVYEIDLPGRVLHVPTAEALLETQRVLNR